jgi:hypothetical protein
MKRSTVHLFTKKRFFQLIATIFLSFTMLLFNNCSGSFVAFDTSSNLDSSALKASFECRNQTESTSSGTHFLSKKQYMNTIEDLFGAPVLTDASAAISSLPNDNFDEEYRRKTSSLDSNSVQGFFASALAISASVVGNTARRNNVFGSCASQTTLSQTCINTFMSSFAARIMRRPLNSVETTFLNSILAGSGTNNEKLEAMLNYLLQSPFFIWRVELGEITDATDNLILSDYESASKLSYAVTDSTPDLELFQAVQSGQFKTFEQHQAQALRLIDTPRGKSKVIDMIMHWSHSENPRDLSGLPSDLTTDVNMSGLEQAMVDEAKKFIEHIVYQSQGNFQDLLKSKLSFASHTGLAKIYNHTPISGNTPVEITERRQGLLMRAPFMTWTGPRTNLIQRGVDFQKRMLCNAIPSPNVDIADDRDVDGFTPAEQLQNTNRVNVTHQTRSPVCMGCHSAINPVGFAFEAFDSIGRLRNQELIFDMNQDFYRFVNIDSSTAIPRPRQSGLPIQDAYELINYVADSAQGHECFVRNAFRYINENRESQKDDCHLNSAFEKLANSKEPIKNVLVDLVLNENLVRKISN